MFTLISCLSSYIQNKINNVCNFFYDITHYPFIIQQSFKPKQFYKYIVFFANFIYHACIGFDTSFNYKNSNCIDLNTHFDKFFNTKKFL